MDLLGIFIAWPALALVPAAGFAWLYLQCRQRVVLIATLVWLGYFPYELGMKLRLLCSGECNIRIDLLLFYPVFAVLSLLALVAWLRTMRSGGSAQE